jgi:(1->4)-alpha-D-glucan 1-alpha-D-glucosylmutase
MAAHSTNPWWWDILRLGPASAYADWLDIDWFTPESLLSGKVLAPFLARDYAHSLNGGNIALIHDSASQSFMIEADGARYPLAPDSLRPREDSIARTLASHDCGTPAGRDCLHALLQRQNYVLAWWRCAADRINWRRFFEISGLIGVRVELPQVFDAVHA